MSSQLSDKVAIVTGSSSGIGEAIAIKFASQGAKVILCGRDQERLKQAFDKAVQASGGHKDRFLTVQGDLNDPKVQKAIIDQTIEKFGRLDILVANAGATSPNGSISNATEESYDTVMNTNLKSVFFLIQKAVPYLEKSKGNIINISSSTTSIIFPVAAVYSIGKAALDHLTRCLAVDLGPRGIRVNGINPGYIHTRLGRNFEAAFDKIRTIIDDAEKAKTPLKSRVLTVEDIAEEAAFLASDAASFITGENIRVDGGRGFGGGLTISLPTADS